MSPRALLSCFPSFAVALHAFLPRVEAAQQAAKQRQEEEVVRAKLPINVLATAYATYIDVERAPTRSYFFRVAPRSAAARRPARPRVSRNPSR